MDFNDIHFRISRIFKSIWELSDSKIEDHYKDEQVRDGNSFSIKISFDWVNDEFTAANKVLLVISNLAKIKDHFKNNFKQRWLDVQIIENTVNWSKHLCWLIDIDNSEKHGYPLNRPRSSEQPRISNIQTCLTLSKNPIDHILKKEINIPNGISYTSNTIVAIVGEVIDKNSNILCEIDELIEKSLSEWEVVYVTYLSE